MITLEKKEMITTFNLEEKNNNFSDILELDKKLLEGEIDFKKGNFIDFSSFLNSTLTFKEKLYGNI